MHVCTSMQYWFLQYLYLRHSVYSIAEPSIPGHWHLYVQASPAAAPLQLLAQFPLPTHTKVHTHTCTHTLHSWVSLVLAPVPQPQPSGRVGTQPSHTQAIGTGPLAQENLSKTEFNEETGGAAPASTGTARHMD